MRVDESKQTRYRDKLSNEKRIEVYQQITWSYNILKKKRELKTSFNQKLMVY